MLFEFDPFTLDLAKCELRRGDLVLPLQPRVFAVLRYLIEHRDRVVGKPELIDALWGGYRLNAAAVPWTINRVRKALGQTDESGYVETVRGYGYRFVGSVQASADPLGAQDAASEHAPAGPPGLAAAPFVGRGLAMQQLGAALDTASQGHGRLVLLAGEAGIGKTRCAEELISLARSRGISVWIGRCFEHGSAPAFWPFIQILRSAHGDSSLHDSSRLELEGILQELEPQARSAEDVPRPLSPLRATSDSRFWLLDRLSRWLVRSCRAQPRLIFLDDLHAADESTLTALSLLSPLLGQARLLLLAAARDAAPTGRALAALSSRLRPCEPLSLQGLRREDVAEWVRAVLGESLAGELASVLVSKSAGNPLFLHELARVALAQYERAGAVRAADLQLPAAATEIISTRLLELTPAARSVLDAAAVVGEELSVPLLQRVTGFAAEAVLSALSTAEQLDIVRFHPAAGKHGFSHPLMREVLYSALSSRERALLHGAVGSALEELGLIDPGLSALAYHFHHAPLDDCFERAARYGRRAGDAALNALAYDEAVRCYDWAREAQAHAFPNDVAAACELLLLSATAHGLAGHLAEARKCCERAIELAREAALPEVLLAAARQLRPSIWFGNIPDPAALAALEHALRILPEDALPQRALALAQLAVLPPHSLRCESTQSLSREAVRLAVAAGSGSSLLLEAQRSRLYGLCGLGTLEEQLRVADDILAQDDVSWRSHADARFARYHAFMQRGDGAAAERELDAYGALAKLCGLRLLSWQRERLIAQQLLHAGQLDEAERRFDALLLEAERLQVQLAAFYHDVQRYALHFDRTGKRQPVPSLSPRRPDSWVHELPGVRVLHVLWNIDAGANSLASRELHALAERDFALLTSDPFAACHLVQLANAAVELDEREIMTRLHALLEPHAGWVAVSSFTLSLGCIARYVARLERALGRSAHARGHLEQAIEVDTRAGHELERLRASLDLAELLAAENKASERARALQLASAVRAQAEGLGAHAISERARRVEGQLLALRSTKHRSLPAASRTRTRSRFHAK